MRNVEDVDRMLDAEDLAVRHDGDRYPPPLVFAGTMSWRKCGVCGAVVANTVKGVCAECRQLEGSVWRHQW